MGNLILIFLIFFDFSVEGARCSYKLAMRLTCPALLVVGDLIVCKIDCVSMLCTSIVSSGSNEVT